MLDVSPSWPWSICSSLSSTRLWELQREWAPKTAQVFNFSLMSSLRILWNLFVHLHLLLQIFPGFSPSLCLYSFMWSPYSFSLNSLVLYVSMPWSASVYETVLHWRKMTSSPQPQSSINSSFASGGISFLLALFLSGIFIRLELMHAVTISESVYFHLPCCISKTTFLWSHSPPLTFRIFLDQICKNLWVFRDDCHINIQFRAEHSEISYSLHVHELWGFVLTDIDNEHWVYLWT